MLLIIYIYSVCVFYWVFLLIKKCMYITYIIKQCMWSPEQPHMSHFYHRPACIKRMCGVTVLFRLGEMSFGMVT